MTMSYRSPAYRLKLAVQENNLPLVVRLRYKTELRNTDSKRLTSLAWAALSGAEDVFEWLLFDAGHDEEELSRDQDDSTILHLLATLPEGNPYYTSTSNTLLSPSSSSLHPSSQPAIPFPSSSSSTAMKGKGKEREEIQAGAVRMMNMYLDVFPHLIDWSNAGGKTALHAASQSGNLGLVRALCEMGADLDLTDLQGNTPMHYAAAWNNLPIIRLLLEFGSLGHQLRNNSSFLPSDYAYSTGLQKEMLIAAKEVAEERRLRRKGSGFISGGIGGGAQSPSGSSAGYGFYVDDGRGGGGRGGSVAGGGGSLASPGGGLRARESRATFRSDDGGGSMAGGYDISPGGGEYPALGIPSSTGIIGGRIAPNHTGETRSPTSWIPSTHPLVHIQRTATRDRDRSDSYSGTPAPGSPAPSSPRRELLNSPSANRVRMDQQQPGSPLASPSSSAFRPPGRITPSNNNNNGSESLSPARSPRMRSPQIRHTTSSESKKSTTSSSSERTRDITSSPTKGLTAKGSVMSRERAVTPTPMNSRPGLGLLPYKADDSGEEGDGETSKGTVTPRTVVNEMIPELGRVV